MKAALPGLRQAEGGSIINISSVAGLVGTGAAAYQATKHAVRLLTKTAAVEYAKDNIRINSIHPGVIATAMVVESFSPRARQRYEKTIPLGREGTAEEIAQGALFLVSDESSYMTGPSWSWTAATLLNNVAERLGALLSWACSPEVLETVRRSGRIGKCRFLRAGSCTHSQGFL